MQQYNDDLKICNQDKEIVLNCFYSVHALWGVS